MKFLVLDSDVERVRYAEVHENEGQNVAPDVDDLEITGLGFAVGLGVDFGELLERIGELGLRQQLIVLWLLSGMRRDDFLGELIGSRHGGQM